MKGVVIASSILLLLAIVVEPGNAITCTDVDMAVAPCVSYLRGLQPKPVDQCCAGVRKLKATVTATADKRFVCQCMKMAAQQFKDLKDDRVSSLPNQCATSLPFPISLSQDCSKLN